MSHAKIPESAQENASESIIRASTEGSKYRYRFAIRAFIGVLFAVTVVEGVAHVRMTQMSQRLWSELQKGERERTDVTRERIDAVVGRPPDESIAVKKPVGEERYDVYRFWGLLKIRELCVHYGVEGIRSPQEAIEILPGFPEGLPKPH